MTYKDSLRTCDLFCVILRKEVGVCGTGQFWFLNAAALLVFSAPYPIVYYKDQMCLVNLR